MKIITYISSGLCFIQLILLLGCKAAAYKEMADSSEQADVVQAADSVGSNFEFESDSISEESIRAFEQRAVQKLKDVSDYVGILSNSSLDLSFRRQAKQMMLDDFAYPENRISFSTLPDNQPERSTIAQFADSLLANQYANLKIEITNVRVAEKLQFQKGQSYKGLLTFALEIIQNNQKLAPQSMAATIYLFKKKKSFGASSTEVWEVFLGDVGM